MTTVLVADDDEVLRMTVKAVLESAGYDVVGEAINGEDAIKKFASLQPDLVMLDIDMPKMSGTEALEEIVKHDEDACVIMLTLIENSAVIDDCLKLGAADYVRKDTPATELIDKVNTIVSKRLKGQGGN